MSIRRLESAKTAWTADEAAGRDMAVFAFVVRITRSGTVGIGRGLCFRRENSSGEQAQLICTTLAYYVTFTDL